MDDAAVGEVDVLPGEVEAAPGEEDPDVGEVLVVPDEPAGVVLGAVEVAAVVLVVGLLEVPGVLGLGDVDRGALVEGWTVGVVVAGVTTVTVTGTFAVEAGRTAK